MVKQIIAGMLPGVRSGSDHVVTTVFPAVLVAGQGATEQLVVCHKQLAGQAWVEQSTVKGQSMYIVHYV